MRAAQATSAFPAAFEHGGKAAFFVISEIIRRDFMKLKFFFDYLSYAVPACAFSLLAKLRRAGLRGGACAGTTTNEAG